MSVTHFSATNDKHPLVLNLPCKNQRATAFDRSKFIRHHGLIVGKEKFVEANACYNPGDVSKSD